TADVDVMSGRSRKLQPLSPFSIRAFSRIIEKMVFHRHEQLVLILSRQLPRRQTEKSLSELFTVDRYRTLIGHQKTDQSIESLGCGSRDERTSEFSLTVTKAKLFQEIA